ncbi:MAG TPA: two-component regulator propeller domain-containing protein, partial [Cyclobacteriaceae bacterium]|nr:two-component regulator propeller domain-containing protein [Cyclobacteriaceae bacterium]
MSRFFTVLLLVSISFSCFAQIEHYNLYNLSTENGLPTNDFQSVYQDSFGFLWLASYDGLFAWDGYTFKKYYHDEKNPNSLNHNIVYSIFEDSNRRLWIGTIEGLNLYDRTTDGFIKCTIRQKGEKIPVNAIREDSKHQLWLGTSFGLCKYEYNKPVNEWFFNETNDDVIFCLAIDNHDNVWTGTFNGGVKKFSQSTKKFQAFTHHPNDPHSIASNKIKSILADHEDNIWIGTAESGVTVLTNEGNVFRHIPILSTEKKTVVPVNCLYEDKNFNIWIGAGREELKYLKNKNEPIRRFTGTFHSSNKNKLLSVSSIHEDSFGNIWFATSGNGLFYSNLNKNAFENYLQDLTSLKGLETNVVTALEEDQQENIWIGTDRGGLLKFNPSINVFSQYNTSNSNLSSNAINEIKKSKDNDLWISTWTGGIMQFNTKTGKSTNYKNNPGDNNSIIINDAKSILPDNDFIWIGTHGEGLALYYPSLHKFIHNNNNSHDIKVKLADPAWINHLFKDTKNRLWISTYSGLFMLRGNELKHYGHNADTATISSNSVNMVTEDKSGNLWVISESGGLDQFNNATNTFTRYNDKLELPETMKGILVDDRNNLWISSNEGILMLDTKTKSIKRYDASDGLQGNSFFHKAVLKSKKGKLYFGGTHGFTAFYPDSLKNIKVPAYFYFTNLFVYNQLQSPGANNSPLQNVLSETEKLELHHDQSFFSIEFAAINLYSPEKTKYAYKLEGLHDQWINIQNERKVAFTNLDPGNYTLKVRYTNADGSWIEAPEGLTIIMLPPWWKTWWFNVCMMALIISSIVAVFYIRISSIKKRNKILKAEVEKQTHELSEANLFLVERNEEIVLQKERLEEINEEVLRQSDKILDQQKHITSQNQKLESTVEELQKLNKTKDHFFSILAHDLKNPISALTGISDFLKNNFSKLEKREAQNYLNSIHRSSGAVYDLLINLLNWSQMQSKKIDYVPSDFDIKEIIQKNITLLEQQFTSKHIVVTHQLKDSYPIYADYNMIDAVIRNVLSNSIKFTEYNGSVNITIEENTDAVTLGITDNGVGMTHEQLEKLFSVDKNNVSVGTAGERGTGLGLVITKEFVVANKGDLRVESMPGRGTSFFITLPKSNQHLKPERKVISLEKTSLDFWEEFPIEKLIKIKGRKILIVDDNRE